MSMSDIQKKPCFADNQFLALATKDDLLRVIKVQQLMLCGLYAEPRIKTDAYLTMKEVFCLFGELSESIHPFYILWSESESCGEWAAYQSADLMLEFLYDETPVDPELVSKWQLIATPVDIVRRCRIAMETENSVDMGPLLKFPHQWIFLKSYSVENEETSILGFFSG